ncbi:hypothetical protein BV22DRAFT_1123602 [Leucogyrophana mollusca]|uniref:Uncharacterized protein n=1 Tax=Leucogyrophana mollusca TaxID=85980 RepID=A0ACB8B273_9AGAM|nr:hypothetical protein BV22DRAFT_1123602 [Leucogyrophana mollusca]
MGVSCSDRARWMPESMKADTRPWINSLRTTTGTVSWGVSVEDIMLAIDAEYRRGSPVGVGERRRHSWRKDRHAVCVDDGGDENETPLSERAPQPKLLEHSRGPETREDCNEQKSPGLTEKQALGGTMTVEYGGSMAKGVSRRDMGRWLEHEGVGPCCAACLLPAHPSGVRQGQGGDGSEAGEDDAQEGGENGEMAARRREVIAPAGTSDRKRRRCPHPPTSPGTSPPHLASTSVSASEPEKTTPSMVSYALQGPPSPVILTAGIIGVEGGCWAAVEKELFAAIWGMSHRER